jgi:hypothetical protein
MQMGVIYSVRSDNWCFSDVNSLFSATVGEEDPRYRGREQGQALSEVLCGNLLGFLEEGHRVSVSFPNNFLRINMREFCVNESRTVLHCYANQATSFPVSY